MFPFHQAIRKKNCKQERLFKKEVSPTVILTFFGQNQIAAIPLIIYKVIKKKHQENKINLFLKEVQIMVCSSPIWRRRCRILKKVRLFFFF